MINTEELKQKNSIMQVASRLGFNVNPVQTTGTKAIKCFVHDDIKTPSLVLMADINRFECKVCADVKGDCINLVEKIKNLSFEEACNWIDSSIVPVEKIKIDPNSYLSLRGIKPETIEKFKLRVDKYFGKDCIAIPIPTGEKYRLLEGDNRYVYKTGTSACLFKTIPSKEKVIITEGEFDAMMVHQETGYPAWSSTGGKGTFQEEWVKDFEGMKKIFLAYDNDKYGREGMRKVAGKLGKERCFYIEVPHESGKDWTDFFMHGKTVKDFNELLKNAKPIKQTMLERLDGIKKKTGERVNVGFRSVDLVCKEEFTTGNTYLMAGLEKSGKSTLLLNFLHNMLFDNQKIVFIDTELGQYDFSIRMAALYNNMTHAEVKNQIKQGNLLHREWTETFKDNLDYYGIDDKEEIVAGGVLSFEKIMANIKDSEAKVVMIDNLTKFLSQAEKGKQGWQTLAEAIDSVINYTKEAQVVTFIVIHTKENTAFTETAPGIISMVKEDPRKIFEKSVTVIRRPTLSDVFGGGGAHSQLSGSFLLWRPYQKFGNPIYQKIACLLLESFRNSPSGVDVMLEFDGEKGIFHELDAYNNPIFPESNIKQSDLDNLQKETDNLEKDLQFSDIE